MERPPVILAWLRRSGEAPHAARRSRLPMAEAIGLSFIAPLFALFLAALLLGAVVSLVQSIFPPYPVMMLTRVLEGVSHLAIVVVGPTAIAGVTSARHQGLAMTLWSSFFGVTYAGLAYFAPALIVAQGAGAPQVSKPRWAGKSRPKIRRVPTRKRCCGV